MTYQPLTLCRHQKKHKKTTYSKKKTLWYVHTEKVLIHMIGEQDAQIFKSHDDYARNKRKFIQYLKYAEIWQSASVICLYAAFLCYILLIVMFIIFFIKYRKTMQAMLAAFISMNTSGIPPTKANLIVEHSPLFLQSISQKKIK